MNTSKSEAIDYDIFSQQKLYFGMIEKEKNGKRKFTSNGISTTKYSLLTFIPKSIFMQFKRTANIYFLIISVLTFMSFSPKNPFSMISTFLIVIIFTMIKEAYEVIFQIYFQDIKRYKQDEEINKNKYSKVFDGKSEINPQFNHVYWEDINVGNIIEIQKDEEIPADILILQTSSETGLCFVDTMNLDGETNLKEKMLPQGLKGLEKEKIIQSSGNIICNQPDENLEQWESVLNIYGFTGSISCR